jgi:2-keto-4-pentenoate hydratase/2-oxohepta-3-ene-1,7-dioic acid hydratase in catechol pathway
LRFVRFRSQGHEYFGRSQEKIIWIYSDAPWCGGIETGETVLLENVDLLTACKPPKVIGVAINYEGATGADVVNQEPLVFLKSPSSIIGDGQKIISPFSGASVWGEPELGVIIGQRLNNASIDNAQAAIFGYLIANDVTCENVYGRDHHLARSKSADTFCVMGSYIDTEFDPIGRFIRGFQNGELIRESTLDQRLFAEPSLLVWISKWITLEPGDVILTGTPPRVADRKFLSNGDKYRCHIEGLDAIENSFFEV